MRTLTVNLGDRSYPIHIGSGLLGDRGLLEPHLVGTQVVLVSNETVAPLYLADVERALAGREVLTHLLPDGEAHKTLAEFERLLDAMLEARLARDCTLIALGGGVVGDLAGFAAASYQRGVRFIQIPTTLLAQVDSSVGGKTAVNHARGKNMIGAFHQPVCVLADTRTLASLPRRELAAGVAEVIKYGAICDAPFFDWLEENLDRVMAGEEGALAHVVERSCRDKATVVQADERERDSRALLNFGHTFGHAFEAGLGYGAWLHGEAVAAGMCVAAAVSVHAGTLEAATARRLVDLIARAGLPTAPPGQLSTDRIIDLMGLDKKIVSGRMRLVLLDGIGAAYVTAEVSRRVLHETLDASRRAA